MGTGAKQILLAAAISAIATAPAVAQSTPLAGPWAANQTDRGVVVALDLGTAGKLTIPGTGPSGRTEALALPIRDVQRADAKATFTVDLPNDEGAIEFEFTLNPDGESGRLSVTRVDGEPSDDEPPSWLVSRVR